MRRVSFVIFGICLLLWGPLVLAAGLQVVFINPGRTEEPYWRSVTRFMQPAAAQLGIELEVLHAERDHLKMLELTSQVARRSRKPDYLIIVNEKLAAGEMLKIAEQAKIKTMLAFSSFEAEQLAEFGRPRQKFQYWIGSITPIAAEAGQLTANELVRQVRRANLQADDGKVHVALIGGDRATPTGVQRLEGAISTFAAMPDVVVDQVVYGNWERERAREQTAALLLRYPKLNAIWTASDLMAFGAMDAAVAAGRKPGKDLLFATVNNSSEVLRARIAGRISALAGGHFSAGGWALVLLHDYHHGVDFSREGLELRLPLFSLLDAEAAQRFLTRFGDDDFSQLDFRQFSKHLTPGRRLYEFNLLTALK